MTTDTNDPLEDEEISRDGSANEFPSDGTLGDISVEMRKSIEHSTRKSEMTDGSAPAEAAALSESDVEEAIAFANEICRGEPDSSILPSGMSVEDFLREDQDALHEWAYRYRLISDLIHAKNGSKEERIHHLRERIMKIQILNRVRDSIENTDDKNPLQKLFPHQMTAFQDLSDFLENGKFAGWIKKPTGAGKTAVFCALAGIAKVKTLILVPKLNLIGQTVSAIQKFSGPDVSVTAFYGKKKEASGQVVVCTYQSLQKLIEEGVEFPLVIGDEFHRSLSGKRKDRLERIPGKLMQIGFSATPRFSKDKSLDDLGECIHELSLTDAIKDELVAGARVVLAQTKTNIRDVELHSASGEYNLAQLSNVINCKSRNASVIALLQNKLIGSSTTAISCVDKNHCEDLTRMAQEAGLRAECVHSDILEKENDRRRERLDTGETQFLFFVDQLTEGWDCPRAEVLVNARPTKSVVVAEQRGGRVLRNHEFEDGRRKLYGLIIEILDQGDRPVLMSDILGGTYVLPERVESAFKRISEGCRESLDKIADMEVVLELEEIARTLSRLAEMYGDSGENMLKMTPEHAIAIIEAGNLTARELCRPTPFFHYMFRHPLFSGSGRQIVKLYFRDNKNLELGQIRQEHFAVMMDDLGLTVAPESMVEKYSTDKLREIFSAYQIDPAKYQLQFTLTDKPKNVISLRNICNRLRTGTITVEGFHIHNELQTKLVQMGYIPDYALMASLIAHTFGTDSENICSMMPQTIGHTVTLLDGFNLDTIHNYIKGDVHSMSRGIPMSKSVWESEVHVGATRIVMTRETLVRAFIPKGTITTPREFSSRLKLHGGTSWNASDCIRAMQMNAMKSCFSQLSESEKENIIDTLLLQFIQMTVPELQNFENFCNFEFNLRPLLPEWYEIYEDARIAWTEKVMLKGADILPLMNLKAVVLESLRQSDTLRSRIQKKIQQEQQNVDKVRLQCAEAEAMFSELRQEESCNVLPKGSRIIFRAKGSQDVYSIYILSERGGFAAKDLAIKGQPEPLTLPDDFFTDNEGFLEIPGTNASEEPKRLSLGRWLQLLNMFF